MPATIISGGTVAMPPADIWIRTDADPMFRHPWVFDPSVSRSYRLEG